MLQAATLALAISRCAVQETPLLRAAQVGVVEVESSGNAWAIDDDNARTSYFPSSYGEAVSLAHALIAHDEAINGSGVDLGIAQINSHNLSRYGLTVETALRACANLRVSSEMLTQTYAAEETALAGTPEPTRSWAALDRTLRAYNSGSSHGPMKYTVQVEAALQDRYVEQTLAMLGVPSQLGDAPSSSPQPIKITMDRQRGRFVVSPPSSLVFGGDLDGINEGSARNGVLPLPVGADNSPSHHQ